MHEYCCIQYDSVCAVLSINLLTDVVALRNLLFRFSSFCLYDENYSVRRRSLVAGPSGRGPSFGSELDSRVTRDAGGGLPSDGACLEGGASSMFYSSVCPCRPYRFYFVSTIP